MVALSGLNQKICRTPMLTTRAQCGGRTSTRCHVAKMFVTQLERMADTASLFPKPCHQAPFLTFLYAWRCRSLSSTSSLISGILCSSVRRMMIVLVANRLLPPRAHIHGLCFADQDEVIIEENIGELAEQVLYFVFSRTLLQCPNPQSSKARFEHMTWGTGF